MRKSKTPRRRMVQLRLPFCGHEVYALLQHVVAEHFPEREIVPPVFFDYVPTLACLEEPHREEASTIWIHHALNDPGTPDYVFSFIFKHELLHTRIRAREIDGSFTSHTPEFRQEEARIAGYDLDRAWKWIWTKFPVGLALVPGQESTWIEDKRMESLLRERLSAWRDPRYL